MRIEIRCAHPARKRKDYGHGWICETERGGCGATGHGEIAHYAPVQYYFEIPDEFADAMMKARGTGK